MSENPLYVSCDYESFLTCIDIYTRQLQLIQPVTNLPFSCTGTFTPTGTGNFVHPTSWDVSGSGPWSTRSWTRTASDSDSDSSPSGAAVGANADLSTSSGSISHGSIAGIVVGVGESINHPPLWETEDRT